VVPADAVLHLHDRDWVFVPAGGNQFKRTEVHAGKMLPAASRRFSPASTPGQQVVQRSESWKPRWRRNDSQAGRFRAQNRWLVLASVVLLFRWGIVSFHNLPVEAYPDVANNYVRHHAQWPGISAEQIEQQVTVPIETR
jgi:hypothetical protein